MTKKEEFKIPKNLEVKSAAHALKLSKKLNSVWSHESRLSQRVLIYIARQQEKQYSLLYQIALDSKKSAQPRLHPSALVVGALIFVVGSVIPLVIYINILG